MQTSLGVGLGKPYRVGCGHEDVADYCPNAEASQQEDDYLLRRHSAAVKHRHQICNACLLHIKRWSWCNRILDEQVVEARSKTCTTVSKLFLAS